MKKTNEKVKKIAKARKYKVVGKLLLIEYSVLAGVMIATSSVQSIFNEINYNYRQSIVQLQNIAYDLHKTNLKNEIIKKQTNYMANEEKVVISEPQVNEERIADGNKTYLGKFKITHYCACQKCCGANAQGITASGKKVEEGKTIAVDTKVIKMGSKVLIDGYGEYEAQDTGSAIKGNIIDVYVADHNQALQMGVQYKDVYLLK